MGPRVLFKEFIAPSYNIRELKARASEIIRGLKNGEEVIITRRGKPCGKLTPVPSSGEIRSSLATLRGAFTNLPDAIYQDFLDINTIWSSGIRQIDGANRDSPTGSAQFLIASEQPE